MPMKIEVDVIGLDRTLKKLDWSKREVRRQMQAAMWKSVALVQRRAATYPPPPPASRYQRTGTLGRSITSRVQLMPRNVLGIVGTRVYYATYVIGPRQAWMHRGRWHTLRGIAKSSLEEILQFFKEAVEFIKRGFQ